jgi:nonsense-mediated mRNA decay protein 3
MFCVECGKEKKIYKDGACIDCYIKSHSFTEGPNQLFLNICSHCESYKYKNLWISNSLDNIIKKIVKNNFKIREDFERVKVYLEYIEQKQEINCRINFLGYIDNKEIREEHKISFQLKRTVCDVCSKRFGGYHEAIIQIRTKNRIFSDDELNQIISFVENQIDALQAKGNKSLFITDIGKEHGGLDFYLSDKASAMTIIKKLQGEYGGTIKKSSKNIGMKDSRQIYKMTYLLRIPDFRKNDIISIDNSLYYILSVSEKKIHIINLSNWNKKYLEISYIKKSLILNSKEFIKEVILVSQNENEVQIMHPETYKINIIKKPKAFIYTTEKIKIIEYDDKFFLYPKNNFFPK